jgi:hypothetical protein
MSAALVGAPPPPPARPLLVLGVLCNERRPRWRQRLRQWYAPFAKRVLVRYILDDKWLRKHGGAAADEVGVPVGVLRDQHCAHKMVGWWSVAQASLRLIAQRANARRAQTLLSPLSFQAWNATFYAKTDDDAMLDLGRVLPLLESLPTSQLYSGILRYSSINETSLEGVCWAAGAYGALRRRRDRRESPTCDRTRGPVVFAEGPLVVMSRDVQAWLAPRLRIDARQQCHFEDLLLGREMAAREALQLANLGPLIAEPNVWAPGGKWLGVHGPLAHWTRTDEAYERVADEFKRAATTAPYGPMPPLRCAPWRISFPRLRDFPCCASWNLCESEAANAEWRELRTVYTRSAREARAARSSVSTSSSSSTGTRAPAPRPNRRKKEGRRTP